jgi:hypothetical protein
MSEEKRNARVDFCFCDGVQEIVCTTREEGLNFRELRGQGKVWKRYFVNGFLEGVTDVTKEMK